jgi:hypothetical protein
MMPAMMTPMISMVSSLVGGRGSPASLPLPTRSGEGSTHT